MNFNSSRWAYGILSKLQMMSFVALLMQAVNAHPAEIVGVVLNEGGNAIRGVPVMLISRDIYSEQADQRQVTASDGVFRFEAVPEGPYSLFAGIGFNIHCFKVEKSVSFMEFEITPITKSTVTLNLSFVVEDEDELFWDDVSVRLTPDRCTPISTPAMLGKYMRLQPDERGGIAIPGLHKGQYIVRVKSREWQAFFNVSILAGYQIIADFIPYEKDRRAVVRAWIGDYFEDRVEVILPCLAPIE